MAWVTPATFSTGQVVTAASWNAFVTENTKYLKGQSGSIAFENAATFSGSIGAPNGQFSGSLLAVGTIAITANSGNQRLLLGNDAGASNPVLLQGSNGNLAIGKGSSFSGSGGTLETYMYVSACQVRIGGGVATNTNITGAGLTIDMVTTANEALTLQSTGCVSHGMTSVTEDATFGLFKKQDSNAGGLEVDGFTEGNLGVQVAAYVTSSCTTKSKTTSGAMNLRALKKNGTSTTNMSADENLLTITGSSIRFIFDADGDFHADAAVSASAYDSHDDVSLVRALELERAPDSTVRDAFDAWVRHSRADLQRLKIATFNDYPGGDGSIFVNYSALTRLHSGALWQMHKRTVGLEEENEALRGQLAGLVHLLETRTGSSFAAPLASGERTH